MKQQILLIVLLLILTSCDIDNTEKINNTIQNTQSTENINPSTDYGEDVEEVISYSGTIIYNEFFRSDSESEYYENSRDTTTQTTYKVKFDRVYFQNYDTSLIYITNLEGRTYYNYNDYEIYKDTNEIYKITIPSTADTFEVAIDQNSIIGQIDNEGYYRISIIPSYYLDKSYFEAIKTEEDPKGKQEFSTISIDHLPIVVGGGDNEECNPDYNDNFIGNPGNCKYKTSGDIEGTYQDLIINEESTNNVIYYWSFSPSETTNTIDEGLSHNSETDEGFDNWYNN